MFPALKVFTVLAVVTIGIVILSYILVFSEKNKKESFGKTQSYRKNTKGLILLLGISSILYCFSGTKLIPGTSEFIDVLKIILTAASLVSFPLSIAGTFIVGFFRKEAIIRTRVPLPVGTIKIRHNTVRMRLSEALRRTFKWWTVISAANLFLIFIMSYFIKIPLGAFSFSNVLNMVKGIYLQYVWCQPFVSVGIVVISVLVLSALTETILKKRTNLLSDEDDAKKRVLSKIAIVSVFAIAAVFFVPVLSGYMGFPLAVSYVYYLKVFEFYFN
ncbi:MAG: hypothetical protein HQL29_04050 [Candidatus Omnitrophica bacterium]|nr:hypothetical protein [Candidatus Omnitrophota bacterium]